jgi:CMP-N-acetylneuraminic acid synthetase
MIKSFANANLIEILINKIKQSKIIPIDNFYLSVYDNELIDIGIKHKINIFHRSEKSAMSEGTPITEIFEWHDKLPYKYVVLISACNPLLKIDTIDNFIKQYITSDKEGGFAVFEKKTYYWDKEGLPITDWGNSRVMNTKFIDPVYEAAHCLYASRMSLIRHGYWMDGNLPPQPELFVMDELEAFDIDYEWQFKIGEIIYNEYNNLQK